MKKSFYPFIIAIVLLWLIPLSASYSQTDMKKKLLASVVTIESGNYSIKEYGLVDTFDKTYEVMLTATAPQSLISRDNFLRIYGSLSSSIFETHFRQEGVKTPDDLNLVKRQVSTKGEINLIVVINMDDKGVHYSIKRSNGTSEMTLNWDQLFFSRD